MRGEEVERGLSRFERDLHADRLVGHDPVALEVEGDPRSDDDRAVALRPDVEPVVDPAEANDLAEVADR